MKFLFLVTVSLSFISCAAPRVAERKSVPPPGSDDLGSQPWNIPQEGQGQGALGGLLEGR